MTASKTLFYLCLAFILGIFINSLIKMPQIFIWVILILAILIIITALFLKNDNFLIAGFCVLFLVLGVMRMQICEFNIADDKLSKLNDGGQITLTGIVSAEPDIRDTFQKLKITVTGSTILVIVKRYPEYKYLDSVKLTGKLETPSVTDEFNYKNYLMKDGIYSVMNFPLVELVSKKHQYTVLSYMYEKILFFKQKIRQSIRSNFSPPQSSILEGTVLGDNGAMSNDLKSKLNITGLRHIIAVSGTHVVILSTIIMSLLLFLGFYRGQAFYFAIIFICFYIILTGLPPSGIRAGIMGGLYLLAQKLGRQSMGPRIITIACAAMVFINPFYLFYDVGFQLSFLAVIGLIYLEPLIKSFFKAGIKRFLRTEVKEKPGNLLSMISTTIAAQIFTLPIMVYNFGNISYVAPITNLLISPIVSLLMIFGFLSSIAGVLSNILGWILSVPCYFLLLYFVWIIDFFSQPWAMKVIQNVSWIWLVISYLVIIVLTRFLNKKYNDSRFASR